MKTNIENYNNHRLISNILIQPKLTVGTVNDVYEQEADAVADRIMRMPEPSVQRKCAHCEEDERIMKKPLTSFIQAKGNEGGMEAPASVSKQIESSRGGGNRLDENTKTFMESRFGTDFSGVKIHTDNTAIQMSRNINAQAFTVGNDIYFNSGKYDPQSDEGKRLLAHELVHTVQQENGLKRNIQRTVDNVVINCADNQIHFLHDGINTSYILDHCNVSDGEYNASVKLQPNKVEFDLGEVSSDVAFDFSYSIAPSQPNPNTFFQGQKSVKINCTHISGFTGMGGDIRFNVKQISEDYFKNLTGNDISAIPEGIMVPLSKYMNQSFASPVPAAVGASYFAPTTWSFIPKNVTGVMWTQGHTSIFSNPSGPYSPSIYGYRGNLGYYTGEMLPLIGQKCTIALHEGVPGSFANDAWFPLFPGEKDIIFQPRTNEQAIDFANKLQKTQYGGEYTYSPPRANPDPILGPVRPTEANLNAELLSRGKAPMCTNNCITVPTAEIQEAIGGRPVTPSGIDVMTGGTAEGKVDPHYSGRGRLMTEAMKEGPLPPGASRMTIKVTPGASAGMFIIRGGGTILLVYGIYQTGSRIINTPSDKLPVVLSEEAGSWTGGILGSALGGAAAGAIFCSPTGPLDAVCVVGGFVGGLLFGIAGSAAGKAAGNFIGENVVEPVLQKAAEVESNWTREIYNLYGVPLF